MVFGQRVDGKVKRVEPGFKSSISNGAIMVKKPQSLTEKSSAIDIRGFSLLEVVFVVALIGIMSAISVPMINQWIPNYRIKGAARDIHGAAMKAKGEAVKRNINIALTFNQEINGSKLPLIVFMDENRNCEYDSGEVILHQMQEWPKGVGFDLSKGGGDGLTFRANDDGNPTIIFRPNGIPTDNLGGLANGSAFLVNSRGNTISVIINRVGNIRIN
jgi:type IV fimbrial biogenesis protein FimT